MSQNLQIRKISRSEKISRAPIFFIHQWFPEKLILDSIAFDLSALQIDKKP